MKATIDFDDSLYRRLKIEAARRGRTIRELVDEAVRYALDSPSTSAPEESQQADWIGSLRKYADNAGGAHDMKSVRASIAQGRARGE
jgi:plasmid stability protein